MHRTTWKHSPRQQQRYPAKLPLAPPLPFPPPAACTVPECPWRPPTPPPPSDATTPPPVEALMPTNPSPAPHTHTSPRRSPPPEREAGSCGVGETAAARQEELPHGRSSFPPPRPLALPNRRRGVVVVRESGARCHGAAAVRLRSVRPCQRCPQSSGKGNECTGRGRARPAYK